MAIARDELTDIAESNSFENLLVILTEWFARLTNTKRYRPDIKWSNGRLFVHDGFRVFELLFGRKYGIRRESTSIVTEDGCTVEYHTFEAAAAGIEAGIRSWLKGITPRLVKIYIPVLKPIGFSAPRLSGTPYLFAIAFDAFTDVQSATATSLTFAHTTSGSERGLVVPDAAAANTTGITYAAVAMTDVGTTMLDDASRKYYIFTLIAPATGANNVVISVDASILIRGWAISYTGVSQTTMVDAVNSGVGLTGTTPSITITSTVDDCWAVASTRNADGTFAAGTNYAPRGAATSLCTGDSNASVGVAGAKTVGGTVVSGASYILGIMIRPALAAGVSTRSRMLMGVGS